MLGRHTSFLQLRRVSEVRLVKHSVHEGISFIDVPLKSRNFKPSRFPKFSGKLSIFEHPQRSRHSSEFKLQMVLGRHTRFLQFLRVNEVRPIKSSIEEGNSTIAVSLKLSSFRSSIIHRFFGKFLNLEHVERFRAP